MPEGDGRGDKHLTAVDLFCGGGGFSTGLALACEDLGHDVRLVAVNHDTDAVETHRRNHPWAEQHNAKVEELHPPNVIGDDDVDLLVAGPECTHFSSARGGKPVNEQRRASPWHVVDWVQKTRPDALLVENVPELKSWGPIDEDGQPTRNGETFEAWVDALCSLGYSIDWDVLNAADYGDATSRRRLFVVGRRDRRATHPEPTHARDPDGDLEPWRPAAEVIDWSDRGESVWARSRPLSNNTMQRIAKGIREHCGDDLAAYADVVASITPEDVEALQEDVVASITPEDVEALQEDVVPADRVADAADDREEPFLVEAEPAAVATDGGEPTSMVMGQHSNARARDASEEPVPTIATRGAIHCIHAEQAFVKPRNGPQRGLHSNATYEPDDRPLHTVTASNHDGHLVSPFLVEYYGNSDTADVEEPLPTVTTKDRHALCVPDLYPWGLDLRYRMLQPRELAAAQGFPEDYEFAGETKAARTAQIGNAVPVNLAKALVTEALTGDEPSLRTYAGDQEVPADD
ncbi:DNA (cytosine-5-)-methyltransferase [Halobacterium salinarum]|uniref:DNA (cytosine-5-)-methyltransferase n=1 Tax=Halobacterium salinarum TaxID=2242 RepID=UPI002553B2C0|nr:DNA cytosine methyltransferase [Halobacterium salinarum]MDL0127093.1 DNA cytosine methyltransferase [Halobacterium salinarum]